MTDTENARVCNPLVDKVRRRRLLEANASPLPTGTRVITVSNQKGGVGTVSYTHLDVYKRQIVIKESSNSSIDKLKNIMIISLCFALIVTALVVSRYCPELLPDFLRLAISVATGN